MHFDEEFGVRRASRLPHQQASWIVALPFRIVMIFVLFLAMAEFFKEESKLIDPKPVDYEQERTVRHKGESFAQDVLESKEPVMESMEDRGPGLHEVHHHADQDRAEKGRKRKEMEAGKEKPNGQMGTPDKLGIADNTAEGKSDAKESPAEGGQPGPSREAASAADNKTDEAVEDGKRKEKEKDSEIEGTGEVGQDGAAPDDTAGEASEAPKETSAEFNSAEEQVDANTDGTAKQAATAAKPPSQDRPKEDSAPSNEARAKDSQERSGRTSSESESPEKKSGQIGKGDTKATTVPEKSTSPTRRLETWLHSGNPKDTGVGSGKSRSQQQESAQQEDQRQQR